MRENDNKNSDLARLLERAQQAVNQGDPVEMLDALSASRYLDGLTRRLQSKWGRSLPSSEVDDCVAHAVDEACAAVFEGRSIPNLGAWLWKAATNTANDKWRWYYAHRDDFDDATMKVGEEAGETVREREEREKLDEVRRKEAIRIARELLPRIGGGQVLDVMELVIDTAENELPDLPASSIAEALGISGNAARTLVSRGLKRLRRLAEDEGVEMPTDLPETNTYQGKKE